MNEDDRIERLQVELIASERECVQLRAELDALRARWDSVPWDDLRVLLMGTAGIDGLYDFRKVVVDWCNDQGSTR